MNIHTLNPSLSVFRFGIFVFFISMNVSCAEPGSDDSSVQKELVTQPTDSSISSIDALDSVTVIASDTLLEIIHTADSVTRKKETLDEVKKDKFTAEESNKLDAQIQQIEKILLQEYRGFKFSFTHDDIQYLQHLLDKELVKRDDYVQLNYMGAVLGRIFEKEMGLEWKMVEDKLGRDAALQYKDSGFMIFPLTMITKRVVEGKAVNVEEIYQFVSKAFRQYKKPESKR